MIIDVQYVTQDNGFLVVMTFIDMTKRDLGILEFIDYNQYTNMESSMVSLRCRECFLLLYSGKSLFNKQLHDALMRCNVLLTENKKKSNFKCRDVIQVLNFLLKVPIE